MLRHAVPLLTLAWALAAGAAQAQSAAPTGNAASGAGSAASGASSATSGAGNAASGANKNGMCQGCHGIVGWRTAYPEVYKVPKIGGQHPEYIVKALQAYRSGERLHPSMRAIASSLSDQDMADLAAYYGGPAPVTASK